MAFEREKLAAGEGTGVADRAAKHDERAEARRKAELEADVKKSLDEVFGDLKIKPPI